MLAIHNESTLTLVYVIGGHLVPSLTLPMI